MGLVEDINRYEKAVQAFNRASAALKETGAEHPPGEDEVDPASQERSVLTVATNNLANASRPLESLIQSIWDEQHKNLREAKTRGAVLSQNLAKAETELSSLVNARMKDPGFSSTNQPLVSPQEMQRIREASDAVKQSRIAARVVMKSVKAGVTADQLRETM